MRRARNDPQLFFAAQPRVSVLIQFDHRLVMAADNQQRRRFDQSQRVAGQVRPPAARNDRADLLAQSGGGHQGRRRARARSEIADPQIPRLLLTGEPLGRRDQSHGQQLDVEAEMARKNVHRLFFAREQVEQQRADAGFANNTRHTPVSRAVTAAPAAVREYRDSARAARDHQGAVEDGAAGGNPRLNFQQIRLTAILFPHRCPVEVFLVPPAGGAQNTSFNARWPWPKRATTPCPMRKAYRAPVRYVASDRDRLRSTTPTL